jgi:hypothetical protein
MDGKGHWIGNVFMKRLARSVKSGALYLHVYTHCLDALTVSRFGTSILQRDSIAGTRSRPLDSRGYRPCLCTLIERKYYAI